MKVSKDASLGPLLNGPWFSALKKLAGIKMALSLLAQQQVAQ